MIAHGSGERVAGRNITVGQEISRADFAVARVAADGAAVVEAAAVGNFEGTRATTDVPAGTLVNRTMFLAGSLVPDGATVVGGSDGGGNLGLLLLVPPDVAPALVAAASFNQVAVARLAPSTTPVVDFAED